MDLAIVKKKFAPVYREADPTGELRDEVLFGALVEVLDTPAPGWCHVRTQYRYEGMVPQDALETGQAHAREWKTFGKMAARTPWLDVLERPEPAAPRVAVIPRGGLVHPLGQADENGWIQVGLPGGGRGYAKQGNLMPQLLDWRGASPGQLREALAATAMSYLGVQHRLGGKTPMGIDCSGLCSISYLLNGAVICRDAALPEGFDLKPTTREKLAMGDIILFGGARPHMAMYLGEDQYVHATGQEGSDGVVINSLKKESPFYREDLAQSSMQFASLF